MITDNDITYTQHYIIIMVIYPLGTYYIIEYQGDITGSLRPHPIIIIRHFFQAVHVAEPTMGKIS